MKKLCSIAIFLFIAMTGFAAELKYRLDYQICGSAASRLLFFFPLRVYYNISVSINFTSSLLPNGKTRFVFENIPRESYLLRTLGFTAKTLALLTMDMDGAKDGLFSDNILALWEKETPEFAARIKNIKKFPHILVKGGKDGLSFTRDKEGRYGDFLVNLEPHYVYYPSRTGIYFNIFPILGEFLNILNHSFTPNLEIANTRQFPTEWNGDWVDFSSDLNRLGEQMEKIVKSLVTIEQQSPFRMKFRVNGNGPDEVEICGEAYPNVSVWKNFMIREVCRRVRLRLADGALVHDEIWVGIRNNKGQGGFGCLRLQLINEWRSANE